MSDSADVPGYVNPLGATIELRSHNAPSCAEQPEGEMTLWSFVEFAPGQIVLLGTFTANGKSRLTSEIVGLDAHRRVVTTTSGRRYRLEGPPGMSAVSGLVLLALVAERGCGRDITQALCAANGLGAP